MNRTPRVVVVGQGYVGLPLAVRAVEAGFDVVGYEIDTHKVAGLRGGRSHIDDIADTTITEMLATGRYRPTAEPADIAGFEIALITVPTPLREGVPDLSFVEQAADLLGAHVTAGSTVVLESTTYPGTTEEVVLPRLEARSGLRAGCDFHVGYSPERIDPGNPTWGLANTPKVVAGHTEACLTAVRDFYSRIVDETVAVGSTRAAELTKLLENTYRHVNIALVNELAIHARELGIDIWEVVTAAATKPFGFAAFWPGPGVGGHCLPIDPSYLSWRIERRLGISSRFIEIANDVNSRMPHYVVQRVLLGLNERSKALRGARVLVLGVSYKRNVGDVRETPALAVVRGLQQLGGVVTYHDPHVTEFADLGEPTVLTPASVAACDVVVLLTDHDDVDYDLVLAHADYVFDTRHHLAGHNVEHL